jgi:hypothetical protein
VVALEAPTPSLAWSRFAKNADIIKFRIACDGTVRPFDCLEYLFETHDIAGFYQALAAQTGRQKSGRQVLLLWCHSFQRDAFPLPWNVVPVEALIVVKSKNTGRLLLRTIRGN